MFPPHVLIAVIDRDVLIAIIGNMSAVTVAVAPVLLWQRKSHAKLDRLEQKVETNHGKRPGEYLEMIDDVRRQVDGLAVTVGEGVGELKAIMASHTAEDSERFDALNAQLSEIVTSVTPVNGV